MRTNFYELLEKREFNPRSEYIALWKLFDEEKRIVYDGRWRSLLEYVNMAHFRSLPFRGSFTSLEEMMDAISLRKQSVVDIDKLLLFCEFLIAVLHNSESEEFPGTNEQKKTIFDNIAYILKRTNHELREDANKNWIIVEKNKSATLAAQLVSDTTVAFDIIEYNHFAIKGHLAEKKKLLTSVAAYIEPILRSKALSGAGYKQLESDAGFIFNNFHIRHNNKEGAKAQDYIVSVRNKELEEWYDKAYEIALSVIIISDYISIGKDIADIKTRYTWRS